MDDNAEILSMINDLNEYQTHILNWNTKPMNFLCYYNVTTILALIEVFSRMLEQSQQHYNTDLRVLHVTK
jgi:hypothetical protein